MTFIHVINALRNLERQLRGKDEPLKREARVIREAFQARADALKAIRREQRKLKPKPKPALVELFFPAFEDVEAFSVSIDVNSATGLAEWNWWRKVWDGTA